MHRDLKLDNIMVSNDCIKICDFGFAKYAANSMYESYLGTPIYMAPELLEKKKYN